MVVACPFCFGLLLVGIAPVEYLTVAELPRCDGLERGAAEIERKAPLDVVEGAVGTHRVHALVALVHYQQVPTQLLDPFQLVVSASEIDGAFQPLQALEAYLPCEVLAGLSPPFQEHIPCHHASATPQRIVVAHKAVARLPRHEFLVVVVPRVGYRRAVGDYQHILRLHLPYQVVGREGLAEARLGVPQEPPLAVMGLKVGFCHVHGILLFLTQLIAVVQAFLLIAASGELLEELPQHGAVDTEPFRVVVTLHAFVFRQVVVEVVVAEIGAVVTIHGDVFPLQFVDDIHRMRLLLDALVDALLCVANLQPSVVAGYLRCAVGIHHPDERVETMYLRCIHHFSFIFFAISEIVLNFAAVII